MHQIQSSFAQWKEMQRDATRCNESYVLRVRATIAEVSCTVAACSLFTMCGRLYGDPRYLMQELGEHGQELFHA